MEFLIPIAKKLGFLHPYVCNYRLAHNPLFFPQSTALDIFQSISFRFLFPNHLYLSISDGSFRFSSDGRFKILPLYDWGRFLSYKAIVYILMEISVPVFQKSISKNAMQFQISISKSVITREFLNRGRFLSYKIALNFLCIFQILDVVLNELSRNLLKLRGVSIYILTLSIIMLCFYIVKLLFFYIFIYFIR